MADVPNLAKKVVEAFGGLTKTARALGLPISTVDGWCRSERGIPPWRDRQIMDAALRERVTLPEEFLKRLNPVAA